MDLLPKEKIPVREDHGLYAFFRRKEGADLVGDARYEVVETPDQVHLVTGGFYCKHLTFQRVRMGQAGVGKLRNCD